MRYLYRYLIIITMIIMTGSVVHAQIKKNCFIAKENGRIVKQTGNIMER